MKKFIHLFLFFAILNFAFSQSSTISGAIYNQKEIGIPYVNVYVNGERNGTVTNEKGQFELTLNQADIDKELVISAIGFETDTLSVTNLPSKIYLKRTTYDLKEITVFSGKKRIIERGNLEFPANGSVPYCTKIGMRVPVGYQALIFLENLTNAEGYFKTISFFITKEGKYKTPFRVKVYSTNVKERKPDSLLVQKDIITTAHKKGTWCLVDVSKHKIPFPKNGAFVAMEWLHNEKEYQYFEKINYRGKKHKIDYYGQGLGLYSKEANYESWSYYPGSGWQKEIPSYKPLIKAQMTIYE